MSMGALSCVLSSLASARSENTWESVENIASAQYSSLGNDSSKDILCVIKYGAMEWNQVINGFKFVNLGLVKTLKLYKYTYFYTSITIPTRSGAKY